MSNQKGTKKGCRMIKNIKAFQEQGLNISQISRALGISRNTVRKYLKSSSVDTLSSPKTYVAPWVDKIDWERLKKNTNSGVALSVFWEENIDDKKEITYISLWREFKRRYPNIPIDFHKNYVPGERAEFDYKGRDKDFGYVDKVTGEFINCRLFGNILCFSQLFYAQATHTEKQGDLFSGIARSFDYFGGVPSTLIFDNAKAQVTKASQYDADLNPEFSYFCEIYNTAPIAARPRKPKDKNLIENALGVFWRWAWPKLKERTYFSLSELNKELQNLCNLFNQRTQKKYGMSRLEKFNDNEKEKLKSLPEMPYFYGEWKSHKVHADSHIQYKYNFYSVPYQCRGKSLDLRISGGMIEVYDGLNRVTIHQCLSDHSRGRYSTEKSHLPEAHRAMIEQTPQWVIKQSEQIGDNTHKVIRRLIEESRHPLMFLRRCQGVLRLKNKYSSEQLEKACSFFTDVTLQDIRINNIEKVITANANQVSNQQTIKRSKNDNLRGQNQWADKTH